MKLPLAYCGIDCNNCPVYISRITGDNYHVNDFAEKIYEKFGGNLEEYKNMKCDGCVVEGLKTPHCEVCKVRECAVEKGISTCADCMLFNDCKILIKQDDDALQPAKENLIKLKKRDK